MGVLGSLGTTSKMNAVTFQLVYSYLGSHYKILIPAIVTVERTTNGNTMIAATITPW